MEPRIHYVQTAEGVSIAYRTPGESKPLVVNARADPWQP